MSRNGAGVYSPSATGYPAVASTTIESAKYNAVLADIATAITGSVACNGESTITGNIPLAGYKLTGIGNASADADALNRVTADARYAALAGATFTGPVIISAAVPYLIIAETDAAANNGKWGFLANGEELSIRAYDDALSGVSQPMIITRTGTTVDSITFAGTTVAITGNATVSGTSGVTGNFAVATNKFTVAAATGNTVVAGTLSANSIDITPASGSFTMQLRATNGGSDLATATANWKKQNGVVTIEIPQLVTTNSTAVLVLDSVPAAIQKTGNAVYVPVVGYNNNATAMVNVLLGVGVDYWSLDVFPIGTGFTATATSKGINSITFSYIL